VLTAKDVLSDIEFELAQGAISHDDLGQGVQAVRKYQNSIRAEVLELSRRRENRRQVATRFFQVNDMLIALAQEMAAAVQSLRLDLRRIAQVADRSPRPTASADLLVTKKPDSDIPAAAEMLTLEQIEQELDERSFADVEEAMQLDALRVGLEVRPARIPIVGSALQRLRAAVHGLVLFYVRRLAQRQVAVNQVYGGRILRLIELVEHQRRQIEALNARIVSLEARLADPGSSTPPSAPSPADVEVAE
jgi:hypothetical protein